MAHADRVRWYRRILAVLAVAEGQPIGEVARLLGKSVRAVRLWVRQYLRHHRVQDLQDQKRAGRPLVATALTNQRIVREFKKDPMRLGDQATDWTVGLLAKHLSRCYRCPITPRTLRRRMKALGLVWKRTRHAYKDPEPHLAQKKGALCGV